MCVHPVRMRLYQLNVGIGSQRLGAEVSINLSLSASESFFRDYFIATATVASFLFALAFALVNTRKCSAPPTVTSDSALCLEGLIQA